MIRADIKVVENKQRIKTVNSGTSVFFEIYDSLPIFIHKKNKMRNDTNSQYHQKHYYSSNTNKNIISGNYEIFYAILLKVQIE